MADEPWWVKVARDVDAIRATRTLSIASNEAPTELLRNSPRVADDTSRRRKHKSKIPRPKAEEHFMPADEDVE